MRFTLIRTALIVSVAVVAVAAGVGLWFSDVHQPDTGIPNDGAIAAAITPGMTLGEGAARRFDAQGLTIGDQFPAIDVFDAEGNPFNTGDLKGQYTVLASGCLT